MSKRKKKGFTLIELIVVIAILGVLAAVAVPRLTGFMGNAAQKTILADIKSIESAASAIVSDNPTLAFSGLKVDTVAASGDFSKYLDSDVIAKYKGATFDDNGKVTTINSITVGGATYKYDAATKTVTKN